MENNNLTKLIEDLRAENSFLKKHNSELSKKLGELKNWTGIREGEIIPRLEKKYGQVSCMNVHVINPISQIVKTLLNIKKLSEVNETNYELARDITIQLVETICKYEWEHLKEMQNLWTSKGIC